MLTLCSKEIADSSPGRHFLTMLARMRTLSERFDVLTILHQTVVSENPCHMPSHAPECQRSAPELFSNKPASCRQKVRMPFGDVVNGLR
mmetsp:Transcript_7249/g.10613  ORF Transcript_7249/g.10613 Transcript_7249/m.10613 type:complete len:89 (+) Transcript_7249:69-335(+)